MSRQQRNFFYLFLSLLFFLIVGRFNLIYTGSNLDEGWKAVLHFARENQLQFGRDIVFTFGPLGFLATGTYLYLESAPHILFGNLLLYFLSSVLLFRILVINKNTVTNIFFSFVIFFFSLIGIVDNNFFILLLLMLLLIGMQDAKKIKSIRKDLLQVFDILLVGFISSMLILIKGTLLISTLVLITLYFVKFSSEKMYKFALLVLFAFCLSFVSLWVSLGQHLSSIDDYFSNSIHVAIGYTNGMSLRETNDTLLLGISVLFLTFLWLLLQTIAQVNNCRKRKDCIYKVLLFLSHALLIFQAWKHGFVRADGHIVVFFYSMPIYIFATSMLLTKKKLMWIGNLIGCLSTVLAIVGISLSPFTSFNFNSSQVFNMIRLNVNAVLHPHFKAQSGLDDQAVASISAIIKDEGIDGFVYNQADLIKAELNYQPRPVFQSYSAYTPSLIKLNSNFIRSNNAPKYYLLSIDTVDGHYPLSEESITLLDLLSRYNFQSKIDKYFLLEQKQDPKNYELQIVDQKAIKFDQKIEINSSIEPQLIKLEIQPSLLGKLLNILYKTPRLLINVELSDDSSQTYRVVAPVAAEGFIINPALSNENDVLNWLEHREVRRIHSILVHEDSRWKTYKNNINLTLFDVLL